MITHIFRIFDNKNVILQKVPITKFNKWSYGGKKIYIYFLNYFKVGAANESRVQYTIIGMLT